MRDFHELEIWRRAHGLALAIYRMTKQLPKEEVFGLTVQLRRAAVGVATRIAEGAGVDSNPDFAGYLQRAKAGASEVEYLLLLARDLGYVPEEDYVRLSEETIEVKKMLSGFVRRI